MMRHLRRVVMLTGALLSAPVTAQIVEQPAGAPVRVQQGQVAGITLPSGVRAWLGVPFAAPPLRELRWRDPQPRAAWKGIWNADRFAPECIQPLRGRTINHYFGEEATSEDCLYLNIWAPPQPPPAGKPYPVVAWIYGGGFNVGSASMANYAGEPLAAKGVVYVAIAYRVGALGFLAHPQLTTEGRGGSGNYGLKDQIASLRWIKDNIAGFGGDPGNVTIAGQSAGSMSVSLLQASPAAKGLFHRVIGMSGSAFGGVSAPAPLAEAEAEGEALQKALGAGSVEEMRDMPADRVLAVASGQRRRAVVIDGMVVPGDPAASFATHRQSDVPIMIGFTRDESFRSLGPIASVADYEKAVRAAFPVKADDVLRRYPATSPETARRAARDIERDATLGLQMDGWARAQATNGRAPVYAYFFTKVQPYTPGITFADHDPATVGAYHTADVPYWLGTLDSLNRFRTTRDWTAADRQLSDSMMGQIVAFARNGRPEAEWPAYRTRQPKVMLLGDKIGTIDWPNAAALPLLADAAPPKPSERPRIRD